MANTIETVADREKMCGIKFVEHQISYKIVPNEIFVSIVSSAWERLEKWSGSHKVTGESKASTIFRYSLSEVDFWNLGLKILQEG